MAVDQPRQQGLPGSINDRDGGRQDILFPDGADAPGPDYYGGVLKDGSPVEDADIPNGEWRANASAGLELTLCWRLRFEVRRQ